MDRPGLKELFKSYYNKTATPEQKAELMRLLKEADPEQLEAVILEAGESLKIIDHIISPERSEKILSTILLNSEAPVHRIETEIIDHSLTDKTKGFWMRWIVAASLIMAIGLGGYFYFTGISQKQNDIVLLPVTPEEILAPTNSRATITLANGRQIFLDSLENGTIAMEGFVNVTKLADGQIVYADAHIGETISETKLIYNTLLNPRGSRVIEMILADGSRVWLNAGSSLTFPVAFTGSDRQVSITGEAYFEVKEDKMKPFKVLFNNAQVEVLGTRFNINAYEDEPDTKTTLLEGSIKINTSNTFKILSPGRQAIVDDHNILIVNNTNVDEAIAWKNGFFEFNNADIKTLLRQSARWYDIQVSYQGNIPSDRFTGKISRTVNLTEFLKVLEYSEVKFKIEGKELRIMP